MIIISNDDSIPITNTTKDDGLPIATPERNDTFNMLNPIVNMDLHERKEKLTKITPKASADSNKNPMGNTKRADYLEMSLSTHAIMQCKKHIRNTKHTTGQTLNTMTISTFVTSCFRLCFTRKRTSLATAIQPSN